MGRNRLNPSPGLKVIASPPLIDNSHMLKWRDAATPFYNFTLTVDLVSRERDSLFRGDVL